MTFHTFENVKEFSILNFTFQPSSAGRGAALALGSVHYTF